MCDEKNEYTIELTPTAIKDLKGLPKKYLKPIDKRILGLRQNPRPSGVVKLKGCNDGYRVRQGPYRILYTINDETKRIVVASIRDRKEAYKK